MDNKRLLELAGLNEAVNPNKAKIDRLIKTMRSFFEANKEERTLWLNGELPPKQKKFMDSIISQAKAIE